MIISKPARQLSPIRATRPQICTAFFYVSLISIAAFAQSITTQPSPQTISGTVLTADGKPAAGAKIVVTRMSRDPGAIEQASAVADSDGKFSVVLSTTQPADAGARSPTIFAYIPGIAISESAPMSSSPLELRLAPRGDAHLSFVDSSGKPIAGVKVHATTILFLSGGRTPGIPFGSFIVLPAGIANDFAGITDANGQCTVPGLPRKAQVGFEADDPSYAKTDVRERVKLADEAVTQCAPIHLGLAASIAGQVINSTTGQPEPGIEVRAESSPQDFKANSARAVSDQQGRFVFTGLQAGAYYLELDLNSPGDKSKQWAADPVPVELTEGLQSRADLKLTRGGVVSGQLRLADSHKPVVGIEIGIYFGSDSAHWINLQMAKSDADGRYSFREPVGKHYLYIATQAPPDGYRLPKDAPNFPEVAEGQTTTVDFEFPVDQVPTLAGIVNDPDGKPAAGATVLCDNPQTGRSMEMTKFALTDATGGFRIPGAKSGATLRARLNKTATQTAFAVNDPSEQVTLDLSASALFVMNVTVTDTAGAAVPAASLELIEQHGPMGQGLPTISPDSHGKATIDSLFTDTQYFIRAQAPGYGVTQSGRLKHTVGTPLPVTLILKKATNVISGTVTDEAGNPLPNMEVEMNGSATGDQTTMSDAQGKFSFAVVDGARANLTFRAPEGHEASFVGAKAGDKDVQLVTHHPQSRPQP